MTYLVRLTAGHLSFDHARLRDLLDALERSDETVRRAQLLRTTIDIFYVHTCLSLFAFRHPQKPQAALDNDIRDLEVLDPIHDLYLARSHNFAKHLREHMAEEEREFMNGSRFLSLPISFDSKPLVQRRQFLDEICGLVSLCKQESGSSVSPPQPSIPAPRQ